MSRIIALFAVVVALASTNVLADQSNNSPCSYPGYKDGACPPDQNPGDKNPKPDLPQRPRPPHGHPGNPGHGGDFGSICSGGFEGYYLGQPFPVAFLVHDNGFGQLNVQAWFRGGIYWGQGVCQRFSPFQAQFEFYFPGAPIHRGYITRNQFGATVMEGQLDFNGPFQLQRTR